MASTIAAGLFVAPNPALAGPVIAGIQAIGGWITGGLTSVFGATVATALTQLGASILLSAVARKLGPKPRQQDVIRELTLPNSLPPYRLVYGECRAPGTPAPVLVKGDVLYGCFILNSRPSTGPFTLFLDKREVEASGDPYDFEGPGAAATNDPFVSHCRYWIGRGDQTSPPDDILAEASDLFDAADGWSGLTVLWLRLVAGANAKRVERWPATPPEVMVDGKWSLLWDPRDSGQDPDDPDTWGWSANQALCVLDALRCNPLRPYANRHLLVDMFADAASVADEAVPVKAGGTIPRYAVNGVLPFSDGTELEDQIEPLLAAGASRAMRVGGKLGIVAGAWVPPVMALDDVLEDEGLRFARYRPSDDLVTAVTATYTSPDREWEDAATPAYTLAGAQAEDGGVEKLGQYDLRLITDHRQAQRVAKILGMRTRMQRSLGGVFPPAAFDLIGGATVTVTLPAPYTHRSGTYEVEEVNPGIDPLGIEGLAMRVGLQLREASAEAYAWDHTTDEQDVTVASFDPTIKAPQPIDDLTSVSDDTTAIIQAGRLVARVYFSFDPSPSAGATAYEWEYRVDTGEWQSGGGIDASVDDGAGRVFGYLAPVEVGRDYTVRVRPVGITGASYWVASAPVTASTGVALAGVPTPIDAVGSSGAILFRFRAPNDDAVQSLEIWAADTDDIGAASFLSGPHYAAPNAVVEATEESLPPSKTRYYFARSIDYNGEKSAFSGSVTATST